MKVMHINCVYKEGSTGKIIYDLEKYNKKKDVDTIILYGMGKKIKEKGKHKILNWMLLKVNTIYTYTTGYMYKGSLIGTIKIIRYIKKYNPDIVHLHSINGHMVNIYILLKYLNKNEINTVITHHAEFFYTGSYTHVPEGSSQYLTGKKEKNINAKKLTNSWFFDRTYKAIHKMKNSIKGFNNLYITSVSPWVNERSKKSFVFKKHPHKIVLNGVDTSVFKPQNISELREKLKLADKKVILHVTSGFDNPIKGSQYILELAEKLDERKFKVIIIGLNKKVKLPKNCINIGVLKDRKELAKYYSLADVTVITSWRETYSMIVAESLSCGTPVVGFKAGGPESISIEKYSEFVEFGDVIKLKEKIMEKIKDKNSEKNNEISKKAHQKYNKDKMAENYFSIYKNMVKK